MTEKEFLQCITKDNCTIVERAVIALRLAKERGAKFDPETIKLPFLNVIQRSSTHDYGYLIVTDNDVCPNREQAKEIIRRCELLPRLREYITTWFVTPEPNSYVQRVLDMIDGKIK